MDKELREFINESPYSTMRYYDMHQYDPWLTAAEIRGIEMGKFDIDELADAIILRQKYPEEWSKIKALS